MDKNNAKSASIADGRDYKTHRSSRFNPLGILALPIICVAVFPLAFLYAHIRIYFPILYIIGFALSAYFLVLGKVTWILNWKLRMANLKITMFFNLIMGLIALYVSWAVLMWVYFKSPSFLSNYPTLIGTTNLHDLLTNPTVLWKYICEMGETEGLTIGYIHRYVLKGAFFWIIVGIESAVIIGSPLYFGYKFLSTSVYCDKCNTWADKDETALVFRHPFVKKYLENGTKICPACKQNIKLEIFKCPFCGESGLNPFYNLTIDYEFFAKIKREFINKCLSFINDAEPAIESTKWYLEVGIEWCKKCKELFAVSLRLVVRSFNIKSLYIGDRKYNLPDTVRDENRHTIVEDMLIDRETFYKIMKAKEKLGEFVPFEEEHLYTLVEDGWIDHETAELMRENFEKIPPVPPTSLPKRKIDLKKLNFILCLAVYGISFIFLVYFFKGHYTNIAGIEKHVKEQYVAGKRVSNQYSEELERTVIEQNGVTRQLRFTGDDFITVINKGRKDLVQLFIKAGINVNFDNGFPLRRATDLAESSIDIVETLIRAGADVNIQYKPYVNYSETPLMNSIENNHFEISKLLLESGADPNIGRNFDGDTALFLAMRRFSSYEIVKLLIEKGADIEARNKRGNTPLIQAACFSKESHAYELMKILLEMGANIEAENNAKNSALYMALSIGHKKIAKLLRSKGAKEPGNIRSLLNEDGP